MAKNSNPSLYTGLPSIPQFQQNSEIHKRLGSTSVEPSNEAQYRYGGLLTYEKPITEWYGDILIPVNAAGSVTTLRAGTELPGNCVNLRFLALAGGVTMSINGGGKRTVLNLDSIGNTEIKSLIIFTDAFGTVIIQAAGTGD